MAFRKKAEFILPLKPDILIVPECEHPDKQKFKAGVAAPNDCLWFGANPHKGLGIFSYSDFTFKPLKVHNPEFKTIVPIAVTGKTYCFTMFAIWANNPADPDGVYVEQVWKAIHYYEKLLSKGNTILIGDFNSNTIWDRVHRKGNHSDVVAFLSEKGIHSAYHIKHKRKHGTEKHPTLFMHRHEDKPYHIDYCFASADLLKSLLQVKVGKFSDWSEMSDHSPLIVDFA